jgi:hypothetical protein
MSFTANKSHTAMRESRHRSHNAMLLVTQDLGGFAGPQ